MAQPVIVVGLDESASSRAALEWAAHHAARTDSVLRALHVLVWPDGLEAADVGSTGRLLAAEAVEDLVRSRITHLFDEIEPRPDWLMQFAHGRAGPVLVHQARHATLLVVGTREDVGLRRLVARSVSHYCLRHAVCPVVAVPAGPPWSGEHQAHTTAAERRELKWRQR